MTYMTVQQAAEAWGVTVRQVQSYCTRGRVPGAQKFGMAWQIPADAAKPADARRKTPARPRPAGQPVGEALMPLMNTAFQPGRCRAAIAAMPKGPRRDIATAEYLYFSGQAEKAARQAELYLTCPDRDARLSACLIYAYANLTLGQIQQARVALGELQTTLARAGKQKQAAAAAFAAASAAVLLHLPMPEEMPPAGDFLPLLPPGLRAFALYVQAHYLYLKEEYALSAGMVEGALAMGAKVYPIPAIYLHLVAVMDYMSLKQTRQAQDHLLAAWALAQPDDLIEGFGEHHGLLGGMLEAVIKPRWPGDFDRIIQITYPFSAGWRKIHNPDTGDNVADNLSTTEFTIAMLAARGWTNQEIADHLGFSPNTVKRYISNAMSALGIQHRQDLKGFMLR